MPKVVFEMVTLGFEHVVICVFRLPPTATRRDDRSDGVITQTMVGDQGIVVKHLTRALIADGEFAPID